MKKHLYLLFLATSLLFAQEPVKVDLSNPNATVYTHLYFLQSNSYAPEKAAKTVLGLEEAEAIDVVQKLKEILDGKGLMVDFSKVPTNAMHMDSVTFGTQHKYVLFPKEAPGIYLEKIGAKWVYSKETVRNTDALYNATFPWFATYLKKFIPNVGYQSLFDIKLWQYIGLCLLLLISWGLFYMLHRILFFVLKRIQSLFSNITNEDITDSLRKLARPISLLLLMAFIKMMLPSLQFILGINHVLFIGLSIVVTVFWIYVFLNLVKVVMSIYRTYAAKTHGKLDDQLVPILHKFLLGLVLFFGLLRFLTILGMDPTTVIAGASIGGLALALASQDTVKNLIGTFMIFLDKPFHIGDWIEAGEVVGTVETVGFRSTTVRAADTSVYQIPNSTLAEIVVNNKGLRAFRRYQTELGLRYDTPAELVDAFVKGVEVIIQNHPSTRKDAYNVAFTGFGDSALIILVNLYFVQLEWGIEQASKHEFHLDILRFAKKLGVDFAFPSSTIMIEQFPDKSSLDMKYNIDEDRIKALMESLKKK
ncbi:MAG: mechanosensitive ion channel protein MscS [Flavobacteriaceae bacterium]|nr:MAG: mechanosensitive ion channel protein MscS [Flavobacteriaceae bacterium]